MAGPLGNIHTVSPNQYMPPQPRFIGTPHIDAGYRANQDIRAQQNHDVAMDKYGFEKDRAIAGIANKEAFNAGLSDIVADPGMAEAEQMQKIGLLAARTGQGDLTLKIQDQEYARQTKAEAQVLELAGNGNVAGAKHLAQQHGVQLPDAVLNDGVLAKGFAIGAKLYDYDPRQAGVFATEFRKTGGDYNAALQAAGEPTRKPERQTYTPLNAIDTATGQPTMLRFNKDTGEADAIPGYSGASGVGGKGGVGGAGGKPSAYEVKIKIFEEAYRGDYADPQMLRKAAIEHVDGGKPMDPIRLRQGAMRMILQQETIAGAPLYKTQEAREAAADEIVRYALQQNATGTTAAPPTATTPGAPSSAPSTVPASPLGSVVPAPPPNIPPGFFPE